MNSENIKTVKFGGSSLASGEQFRKVRDIITADPERRYVIPSAPGKRFGDDTKVTDLLYACYEKASRGENIDVIFDRIKERYDSIIADLAPYRNMVINNICTAVDPDSISVEDGLALIAVVGRNMVKAKGTAARVLTAAAQAGVNIRMIDQGSCEINIILGVADDDFEKAVEAIYREFEE